VQIALNGADHSRMLRRHPCRNQPGFENAQSLLHRAGSHHHLRHENLVALKLFTHDRHPRHQALLNDEVRLLARVETGLDQLGDFFSFAIDDDLGKTMLFSHCDPA